MRNLTPTLQRLIAEATELHEQFMSRDDAEKLIARMDMTAIAQHDIVDEESGEVYVTAGDPFSKSSLSPHYVARRTPSRYRHTSIEDDDIADDGSESLADMLVQAEEDVRSEWLEAAAEYAANWRGWAYDHVEEYDGDADPEQLAHGSALDAADGFFHEHDGWERWATTLGMSKSTMRQAIAEFVYEEMRKPV